MGENKVHLKCPKGVVYAANIVGHRHEYLELFANLFGLRPVSGQLSSKKFIALVSEPRLLFATIDDHLPSFVAISVARTLMGRKTTALFLRPQSCFAGKSLKNSVKLSLFKVLRRLRGLTIATITPFVFEPKFAQVAHIGLYDPQLWDMYDGTSLTVPINTELSLEVLKSASGRPIVCFVGYLDSNKGFGFLTEFLNRNPHIAARCLFLAAGLSLPGTKETARCFAASGGMLIDREIEAQELFSLFAVADLVWCCYSPEYNQASGIFGRSVQFGTPVLLRKDSLVDRLATELDAQSTSIQWEDFVALEKVILSLKAGHSTHEPSARSSMQIKEWRKNFLDLIGDSIDSAN